MRGTDCKSEGAVLLPPRIPQPCQSHCWNLSKGLEQRRLVFHILHHRINVTAANVHEEYFLTACGWFPADSSVGPAAQSMPISSPAMLPKPI